MTEEETAVIARFVSDTYTSDVVFRSIREKFLAQDNEKDIHYLAAKSIAVNLLDKALKEMKNTTNRKGTVEKTQAGL